MKPRFKKSRETMVSQWANRNKRLLGIPENVSACDIQYKESLEGRKFEIIWGKIHAFVECHKRVNPSTLQIFNHQ